jgi:hypothetical protein
VITNAVRDAAAEAMTMRMPAVEADTAPHGAPTEPLPVLRDDEADAGQGTDSGPLTDDSSVADSADRVGSDAGFESAASGSIVASGRPASGRLANGAGSESAASGLAASGDSVAGGELAADRVSGGAGSGSGSGSAASGSSAAADVSRAGSSAFGEPVSDQASGVSSSALDLPKPAVLADAATVSFRSLSSTELVLPETVAEVVAVVDAASRAIAAAEDAARQVAEATAAEVVAPPAVLDLREPAPPAPVPGVLDLLAPVVERPLLVVEQPPLPAAPDLMALHRAEFEGDFVEPPVVAAGDEPPIPTRFGPGLAVLPHIEFPV